MTNKDEALKQLMDWYDSGAEDREGFETLVKLALASPTVQEPVADVYMAGSMKTNIGTYGRVVYVSIVYSEKPLAKGDKLYTTTPPAQPAVPDAIRHTDHSENMEYIRGWNECRELTIQMQITSPTKQGGAA
jgi:hypothetical protein